MSASGFVAAGLLAALVLVAPSPATVGARAAGVTPVVVPSVPGDPEPPSEGGAAPDVDDEGSDRVSLVPVPPGCPAPELPDVVFVGTVVERDYRTVRFLVGTVRAGSPTPFAVDGRIDVRYGLDAQYLDVGAEYLVSARRDPLLGVLASRLRDPAPEFGGDDIVGLEDADRRCPEAEDPVRTLFVDGTVVPTSVLAPILESRTQVLGAVLLPVGVAFGLIFLLAMLRLGVSGVARGVRSASRRARR